MKARFRRMMAMVLVAILMLSMLGIAEEYEFEEVLQEESEYFEEPIEEPTPEPTLEPTEGPASEPTDVPTPEPTNAPAQPPVEDSGDGATQEPAAQPTQPVVWEDELPSAGESDADETMPGDGNSEDVIPPVEEPAEPEQLLEVRLEQTGAAELFAAVTAQGVDEIAYQWQTLDSGAYTEMLMSGMVDAESLWQDIDGATDETLDAAEAMGDNYADYGYRCVVTAGDLRAVSDTYRFLRVVLQLERGEEDASSDDDIALLAATVASCAGDPDLSAHTWKNSKGNYTGKCAKCGYVCPHVDESGSNAFYWYSDKYNQCEICKFKCSHTSTYWEENEGAYFSDKSPESDGRWIFTKLTDERKLKYHQTQYAIIGRIKRCSLCDEWISDQAYTQENWTYKIAIEPHEYDNGICVYCGYVNECTNNVHKNPDSLEWVLPDEAMENYYGQPEYKDEEYHETRYGGWATRKICPTCGETVAWNDITSADYIEDEAHTFVPIGNGSSYKCTKCYYTTDKVPCEHLNTTPTADEPVEKNVHYKDNGKNHIRVRTVYTTQTCDACGVKLVTVETEEDEEAHSDDYAATGFCLICGNNDGCKHLEFTTELAYAQDVVSGYKPAYSKFDADSHRITTKMYRVTYCKICAKFMSQEATGETVTYTANHNFPTSAYKQYEVVGEDGGSIYIDYIKAGSVCKNCGYKEPASSCKHKNKEKRPSEHHLDFKDVYSKNDAETHFVNYANGNYDEVCLDCGRLLKINRSWPEGEAPENGTEPHELSWYEGPDGIWTSKCWKCGEDSITCEHDFKEIVTSYYEEDYASFVETFQSKDYYCNTGSSENHLHGMLVAMHDLECGKCGMIWSEHSYDEKLKFNGKLYPYYTEKAPEEEPHDFVNGVCTLCGYKFAIIYDVEKLSLGIGETYTPNLDLQLENPNSEYLNFKSSNPKIFKVNNTETGEVMGVAAGTATLTATYTAEDGTTYTDTIKITVKKAPTEIKLSATELTLGVREPWTLKATLAPSGSYGNVVWSSSDKAVLSVEDGVLTAHKPSEKGKDVTITATVYDSKNPNQKLEATCTVTVNDPPTTNTMFVDTKNTLGVGESVTASAMAEDGKGGTYALNLANCTFATSNKKIATVSKTGKITGVKKGPATITVTAYNGAKAELPLEVIAAPTMITLLNKTTTLGVGEPWMLGAKVVSGKTEITDNVQYTFSSNKKSVLEVDPKTGELTAHETGVATITVATYNKKKASVKITVKAAPTEINLQKGTEIVNGTTLELGLNETVTLKTAFDSTKQYGHVTWGPIDSPVVSVENGKLTASAEQTGTATITASVYDSKHPGQTLTAQCTVNVKAEPTADNATLTPAKAKIGVGESTQLSVVYTNAAGAVKSYKSSKTSIATVSSKGVVKGVKKGGPVTITATMYNGEKITTEIQVIDAPTKVELSQTEISMKVGDAKINLAQYVTLSPVDNCSGTVTFKSSKPSVAKVDTATGELEAIGEGTTVITVTTQNKRTARFNVTVTP